MSDLLAKCDWNGDVLVLTLSQDPSSIHVKLFDSKHAPLKGYVPVTDPDALGAIRCLQGLTEATGEENAKLRELVRDAWGGGHPDRSCEGCDIRDECHDDLERLRKDGMLRFSRCLFELRIEDRMRELGIEVE